MSIRTRNELIDLMSESIAILGEVPRLDGAFRPLLGSHYQEPRECTEAKETLFAAAYNFLSTYGYKWFRRNSHSIPDFDDLLSNTMLAAFTKIDVFYGSNGWAFLAWLLSLGRTAQRKELHRLERYRRAAAVAASSEASREASPDSRLADREEHEKREMFVRSILEMIPQEFRELLASQLLEGRSIQDLSILYGLPPNTVKTKLRRGKQRLWDILWRMGLNFDIIMGIEPLKDARVQAVNRELKIPYFQHHSPGSEPSTAH